MSILKKLVKTVISSLSCDEKDELLTKIMILKCSMKSLKYKYRIVDINEDILGDLCDTSIFLKTKYLGYIILTIIDHSRDFVSVLDEDIKIVTEFNCCMIETESDDIFTKSNEIQSVTSSRTNQMDVSKKIKYMRNLSKF
jgi:hypothetical protein